jgi:hypothetical protein
VYEDEPTDPYGDYSGEVEWADPVEEKDWLVTVVNVIVWTSAMVFWVYCAAVAVAIFLLMM